MVTKQTKTTKSKTYTAFAYKYTLALRTLEGWQQKYHKSAGAKAGDDLMLTVIASVNGMMRPIEKRYSATGEEYITDRNDITTAVRDDICDWTPEAAVTTVTAEE